MIWHDVWLWVGGMVSGIGVAALLDNFLERRITAAFESEDDHERR